ncbi:MAG TPA: DUF4159 domain-containing protein [Pirellulales bacterium]|jgi:hypothetical protein|nr:DUF4159 domain-containing protein [Pirellulales bacterium]
MSSLRLRLLVLMVWLGWSAAMVRGAELKGDEVRSAIAKAVRFLKDQQKPDGSWDEHVGITYGVTSLVTLALLNAGVPTDDPKMAKSLSYLRLKKPDKTYAVALQTMVFCAATPKKDLSLISRNANMLASSQITGGELPGAWSYEGSGGMNFVAGGDNSNAQFALLALHEAELAGAKVNPQVWQLARKYWESVQNPDGSWGYHPGNAGTGSMTCAGISSMIIALGHTSKGDAVVEGDRVLCCGQQQRVDSVERGLEWLGHNFTVNANPVAGGGFAMLNQATIWRLYYLYGLERAGRMSARRFVGTHDWYREGSRALIDEQDKTSGWWQTRESPDNNNDKNISTSLGLLFLSKGRRPVLISKLKYGPDQDWNHHRSDLANLTVYVEGKWSRPLIYQVIDLERSTVEDLEQTPVLFLNGSQRPVFTPAQVRLLRDYINRGGFIFAEATCPECAEFHRGIQELVKQMFPEPEYGLKLLPPEHPIWHAEERIAPELVRPLYGIDYGCRTCFVYAPPSRPSDPPGNLSCYWELGHLDRERDRKYPEKIRAQIDAAFAIGINVLAYATNRDPKFKDELLPTLSDDQKQDKTERGKLYVANVRHAGGSDIAPGALPNVLMFAEKQLHVRVGIDPRQVTLTDEKLYNYPLVFMHGRSAFRLSKEEREALRKYIIDGEGTMLADAICANKAFAASFRSEMQAIFPQNPLKPIPPTDPLLSDRQGGYDLSKVKRREPQAGGEEDPLKVKFREGPAELEGIKVGDRYAIIFSPYDLSCALENHQSLECEGYVREDAARIALNVIVYFLQGSSGKDAGSK